MNYFVRRQDNEYGNCDGMLHEIKERDSLYKVSRLYGVTLNDLMEKNPTVDVYNLTIGDKLCVPVKHIPYIIQSGDTLDWLLEHFNMDYDMFRKANPQLAPWTLEENSVVYIPQNEG
ncbi:MAG: LysM peptidoglycan-binding domain-containing protein [Clostridia bacterium]|nr:LysM peptidoglycan-binding domain-containing protein [Lachnospiraceae bacterium]NCB99293.1 LysM peptidoglycan-binding domain-containing protein [Clostridia bacterium]NCD01442.1 LysM peptidoglycan-binding domain-containing protein [Clostridia bacterium]